MDTVQRAKDKQTRRPLVLASVMIGMFLSAIEATIVATAMPNIVADLGGFSLYSWVFSSYLLTMSTTVLIFGKLSDIFGRKPIYIIGVAIFLTGSTLSGFSMTMNMLIAARFIQGVGAGALMPIATTIVGDIYSIEERAKIQGYLSSIWGISAVSGPLLGGFFVYVLNWRYVFWMNIPLGLLAVLGIYFFFHERIEREKRPIDYLGTVLTVVMISTLMYILVEGGLSIAWNSSMMITLIIVVVISFILFLYQEKRAVEPMMPLSIWNNRLIAIANIASLTTGMITIGVTSYLPAFVQGVMGKSATIAGFSLTSMSIGWPIASTIAGRLLLIIGYRRTSLIGATSLIIGGIFFFTLTPDKGPVWAGIGSYFIGTGMGLTTTSFVVGIQSHVTWELRGIATATNMFMRSLGSAVGVALLGGLLNNYIHQLIIERNMENEVSVDTVNQLLDPHEANLLTEEITNLLKEGLAGGLHIVYIGLLLLAIMTMLFIYFMPKNDTITKKNS